MGNDGFPELIVHSEADARLCLDLTAAAALSGMWPRTLCGQLVAATILDPKRSADVELALHEALTNAALHGNLGIASTPPDLADRHAAVMQALAQPERALMPIHVEARWDADSLTITIRDQGGGFDVDAIAPAALDARATLDAKTGRGHRIIRSLTDDVTFADEGRCIRLLFHR